MSRNWTKFIRKQKALAVAVRLALAARCTIAFAQNVNDVLGTWEGESKCTVASSPCHDEHVIYEIAQSQNSQELTVTMDKVVNGERGTMGSLSCRLQDNDLNCTYNSSHWDFTVQGKQMIGTLKLADGTLYRRISAKKK